MYSRDSLVILGYTNASFARFKSISCKVNNPLCVALILIEFGNVAIGLSISCCMLTNFVKSSSLRNVLDTPVSAFITGITIELVFKFFA